MIEAVLNHLWHSTLVLAVAGLLTLALRRNGAAGRHALWLAASVKFLLPLAALDAVLPRTTPVLGVELPLRAMSAVAGRVATLSAPGVPRPGVAPGHPGVLAAHLPAAVLWVWALGCAAVIWSWLRQLRHVYRARRTAIPLPFAAPLPVLESHLPIEPSLVGIRRPAVLFPRGLTGRLAPAEIDAILAHELSHLRRRDNLTGALHMLVQALFWFYPPVWWLGARLLAERERACDEAVLAAGTDAAVYAGGILKVCRFFAQPVMACAAGVSGSNLQQRVESIMSDSRIRAVGPVKKALVAGVLAVALGLCALTGAPTVPAAQAKSFPTGESAAARHARLLAEQTRPQKEIAFKPADFDRFVGYYQLTPAQFFHVFRRGDHYFAQLTGQPPVREYPESPTQFFATIVPAQISFLSNARGAVTALVLHQNGELHPARRVSRRLALQAQAALAKRIRNNVASPGSAAAVRAQIESFERTGHALYSQMTPGLAAAARRQAARDPGLFESLGALRSLRHYKVLPNGVDDYLATFAHGRLEVFIAPLTPGGKVGGLFLHPVP